DPQGIHQIRTLIKQIASEGTTILLASHLLDEVEKVCSHVVVLRKGEKLYSGRVDEMVSSFGFFELRTEKTSELVKLLQADAAFNKVTELDGLVTAFLEQPMDASDFNKMMYEKGIVLSHLVKRKPSLEEQFLQLTDSTNPTKN
ncbi:MAG: ABC transporter ATP-binding protein, partial [Mangrovimonas sp.]|nr:ABC transporter ATP-binding protein [Mangrovimonas sp.]